MKLTTAAVISAFSPIVPSSLPEDTSMGPLLAGPPSQSPAPTSYDCQAGLSSLSSCSSAFFAQDTVKDTPKLDPACQSLMLESNYLFSTCAPPTTVADVHELTVRSAFSTGDETHTKERSKHMTAEPSAIHSFAPHHTARSELDSSTDGYCECPKGSSVQNQDVQMLDGKFEKLCACCDKGAQGIYQTLAEDGSLICFKLAGIDGLGLNYVPGWNRTAVGGQSCINNAVICPGHPKGCCSGSEFNSSLTKRGQKPTTASTVPAPSAVDKGPPRLARDLPPWAGGHWMPWGGGNWMPWTVSHETASIETTFKTSTSTLTIIVTPANSNSIHQQSAHIVTKSNPSVQSTTSYETAQTVTMPNLATANGVISTPVANAVIPTCIPRVPTSGTEAMKSTTFEVVLGTAAPQFRSYVHADSGICTYCKNLAASDWSDAPYGFTKQQYHDEVCCGFPYDTQTTSVWHC